MSFIGDDAYPSPQIREVELKHGSKKWTHFYVQLMVAVRRLYHCARLVHADLSEYNVLLCADKHLGGRGEDVRTCIIDFGQAVDLAHPRSLEFLRRDVERLNQFFSKKGVLVPDLEEALTFVSEEVPAEDGWEMPDRRETFDGNEEDGDGYVVIPPTSWISTDVRENPDKSNAWRHMVPGWDDEMEYARLEDKILKRSQQNVENKN